MNIAKAYIGGFQQSLRSPRMILILYAVNILTALILALPFMNTLKEGFGNSGIVENLVSDFDYTTLSNFMFYSGKGVYAIFSGVKWLVLAYFIISVFLTGGILRTLNKEKFTTSTFFAGSAYNFFRLLGLAAIMIIVQIIFALLVYVPMGLIIKSIMPSVSSEITLYIVVFTAIILHLLLFLLVSMIGDYAKFYLVLDDSFNIFKGFWKGVKYVFSNFFKTYSLYFILFILPAAFMYLYLYLEKDIKMATGIGILIVFLLQQAFILLRVILRVWVLSSQLKIYSDDFIKSDGMQQIVMEVEDVEDVEKEVLSKKEKAKIEKVVNPDNKKYKIDFNKTFETNKTEGKVVSEEEVLKKIEEQEKAIEKPINEDVIEDKKENDKEIKDKKNDDDMIELDL